VPAPAALRFGELSPDVRGAEFVRCPGGEDEAFGPSLAFRVVSQRIDCQLGQGERPPRLLRFHVAMARTDRHT